MGNWPYSRSRGIALAATFAALISLTSALRIPLDPITQVPITLQVFVVYLAAALLGARYGALHVDKAAFPLFANPTSAAREAESWGLSLNWYLNRNLRFMLNYEQTHFTGGSTHGDRPPEHAILSRFQIVY